MRACAMLVLVGAVVGGCAAPGSPDANVSIVRGAIDAINRADYEGLERYIASGYVRHTRAAPGAEVESLDDFRLWLELDRTVLPDAMLTIDQLVAEGDRVAFFGRIEGTQEGPYGPFPATGKRMNVDVAGVHRIEDGRIAESWITWDNLSALIQLGHFPAPPGAVSSE